jgi:hypothetical protein
MLLSFDRDSARGCRLHSTLRYVGEYDFCRDSDEDITGLCICSGNCGMDSDRALSFSLANDPLSDDRSTINWQEQSHSMSVINLPILFILVTSLVRAVAGWDASKPEAVQHHDGRRPAPAPRGLATRSPCRRIATKRACASPSKRHIPLFYAASSSQNLRATPRRSLGSLSPFTFDLTATTSLL